MLVLTRKRGETVLLSVRDPWNESRTDRIDIMLRIGRIHGNSVRVEIEAPVAVEVVRGELLPGGYPHESDA